MGDAVGRLRAGLASLGFDADRMAPPLLEFARIVLDANTSTNLVGAKDLEGLVAPQLLDCLAPFAGKSIRGMLVDVGSGAGLPAIPIAIAYPALKVTMLEPRARRQSFLEEAIRQLGLRNATARKAMSETVGRSDLRQRADVVTVRAVAKPVTALELGAPLLMISGKLLLYEGKQAGPTEHELEVASVLGLALEKAHAVEVPYLQGVRHAWWFRKKKATPGDYPRRSKTPSKQPL